MGSTKPYRPMPALSPSARRSASPSASAAIDLSGRPLCVFDARRLPSLVIGGFETELCEEFMRALASTSRMTLHVRVEAGRSAHHMIEAAFKAFARALRAATALDGAGGGIPSTKGVL